MELLQRIFVETAAMLAASAPFLLLGLLIAGLLHVLVPQHVLLRFLGGRGMMGAVKAAMIGIPLPICSCGVVPIGIELRRKGASQPASMSFLTTTPESGIDSILLSWGMLGPVMAVARPVAAFFTAMIGGVLSIAYLPERRRKLRAVDEGDAEPEPAHDHAHDHDHHHHDHHHHHGHGDHDHAHDLGATDNQALETLKLAARRLFSWSPIPAEEGPSATRRLWTDVLRPALRYGFVELLDDIAFWIVAGLLLAGGISALLPADLSELGRGGYWLAMLAMLLVGIPLYLCAAAGTPVAAALMAKGLSPGAALVFLLAAPATSTATVLLLTQAFGKRFVKVYLTSIVIGALASGILLDLLVGYFGWNLGARAFDASEAALGFWDWSFFLLTLGLLAWRLWQGAAQAGLSELRQQVWPKVPGLRATAPASEGGGEWRRRLLWAVPAFALVLYLGSGFERVPAEGRGYGFVLGRLVSPDVEPGLAWNPPWPVGSFEVRRVHYPRKADVGFRTDLGMLADRRRLALTANQDDWHSPVAAMNANSEVSTYLTADENLVEMSFTVHYGAADARAFFYQLNHEQQLDRQVDIIGLYAATEARELVASRFLDALLTEERARLEEAIRTGLAERVAKVGLGVRIDAVRIVDIHPPSEVVSSFRDVASAREDRETRIHRAKELLAREVPRARGEAVRLRAEAEALAAGQSRTALGKSEAFLAQAGAMRGDRRLLLDLLWRESAERVLPGREKYVVPKGQAGRGVTLWRDAPPPPSRTGG